MEIQEYMKVLREKALSDCRPDFSFWTCHGRVVRNVYEMADAIDGMNDDAFRYHVNDDNKKNDFANWLLNIIEDGELAHRLKKVRDRQTYVKIIRDRIRELEEY